MKKILNFFGVFCFFFLLSLICNAQQEYKLVTNVSDLIVGDKYIVVSEGKAMGMQNNNNRAAVAIPAAVNDIITINAEDVNVFVLGGTVGAYTFYDETSGGGYLYAASSSSNYLKIQTVNDNNGKWNITVASDGVASVVAQGTNTRKNMKYNSGSTLFSCYSSGQKSIYLYRLIQANTPNIGVTQELNSFSYIFGNGPSVSQSISIVGSNLTSNVSVVAPTNYEVATSIDGVYSNSLILTQSLGSVSANVYLRLKSNLAVGLYNSGILTISSTGAADKTVTCNGKVSPAFFSVTNDLTNVTNTNSSATIANGGSYSGILTAAGGYEVTNVSITMDGTNITSTAYNAATGEISVTAVTGDIVITATALQPAVEEKYELVTSVDDIVIGKKYIIVGKNNSNQNYFASGAQSGTIRKSVSISSPVGNIVTTTPAAAVSDEAAFEFIIGGSENAYTFKDNVAGTYLNLSSNSNSLSSVATDNNDYSKWTISIAATGEASIKNNGYTSRILQYNASSPRFACYTSTQSPIYLYRESSTDPYITISGTLNQFSYLVDNGPSVVRQIRVQGRNLTSNLSVAVPANFEISTNATSGFGNELTLTQTNGTISETIIYIRLVAGLSVGNYSGTLNVSGGGAESATLSLNGRVFDQGSEKFDKGDFAVIAVNSNTGICKTSDYGGDEISFITFKDILNGDSFTMTDNGYEYANDGLWGNREGTIEVVRTGSVILAGTVITIRTYNDNSYECISPDNDWTFTNVSGAPLVLNSGGDQIYFMQGGTWDDGASRGSNDAQYVGGELLFAFNTNDSWTPFVGNSSNSGLAPGMDCFSMMPGAATDFIEYTGPTTPATKRDWIGRINNSGNWANRNNCSEFYDNNIHFGKTYEIISGGYTEGLWTGDESTDWFDCSNWDDLEIPDSTVNVVIPTGNDIPNEPFISEPPTSPIAYERAECNNIDIQLGRTLTMNEANSRLDIFGDIVNNGLLSAVSGSVNVVDDNSSISGSGVNNFYNLNIRKNDINSLFFLNTDININGILGFEKGKISTSDNKVIVKNTSLSAISGHNESKYIVGNLRRFVKNTGSYDLPVGTASFYELANVNLNSSSIISFIDAKFTNPHTSPISISSLNLKVNETLLEELLNYGFWTIVPDGGTYNYDVTLTSRGHTNQGSDAASHAIVKRQNSIQDWTSVGTHVNSEQSMGANWVRSKRNALTAFSDFAIAKTNSGVLPVELISFSAELVNSSAFLSWNTATETNCSHFVIQRSVGNQSEFKSIAVVIGAGNTNEMQQYSFVDDNVEEGINYYRLLQYDFDGSENIIAYNYVVLNNEAPEISLANVVSVDGMVAADVYNIKGEKLKVELMDARGNIIETQILQAENTECRIVVSKLISQGVYFLKVSDAVSSTQLKFLAL